MSTPPESPTSVVVDASVAIKWYLPETHSAEALRLLDGAYTLLAPDLLFAEAGNILWKRVRASEITQQEAEMVLTALGKLPLQVHPAWPLVLPALEIACRTQRTVYDSLYLALAIREGAVMVTADARLYHALASDPLASYVLWVEKVARGVAPAAR